MSFLYPRIVSITRPQQLQSTDLGKIPYQALDATQEIPVITSVPASIQYDSTTDRLASQLPGDIYRGLRWKIFIPRRYVSQGLIKDNDIVTDDEGIRYQVSGAYWNSLGCNLKCERLQN